MDTFLGSESLSDDTPVVSEKKKSSFADEWSRAEAYWVEKHATFNRNYLFYRGITSWTERGSGGFSFSRYFGTQVHVPRTFQTVESLFAQIVSREIEFSCVGTDWVSSERERYVERMDNAEFARSGARAEVMKAFHNSLIFGNGYLLNTMTDDRRLLHIPVITQETDKDGKKTAKIEWNEEWVSKYKGVKPRSLNVFYVFPDPYATSMEDWRHCFVYSEIDVAELRRFAVANGWKSEAEALKDIQPGNTKNYDSVRNSTDLLYSTQSGSFGQESGAIPGSDAEPLRDTENMVGIVERFSEDGYEMRIADSETVLYEDYNVYLHKEIPIIVIHDYKLPDEFLAQGEPEIIRWQQVEENKIHNLVLYGTLMSVVQRYSVNSSLLEDPSDAAFYDPFRPIRVKAGLGGSVMNAVQALPTPDMKQGPFKLMELVKEISQQTTGATDLLVSASQSMSDTATESNNLMAATAQRVRAKIRNVEIALQKMVSQWHKCYVQFYDDELDVPAVTEKNRFFKFIPFRKEEADNDGSLIDDARKKLNALGETLTEVYLNKGYKDVVFLSDLDGTWNTQATVKDSTLFFNQTLDTYSKILTALGQANNFEQASGSAKRFDTFKIAEDMLRLFPMIKDSASYVTENVAVAAQQEARQQASQAQDPTAGLPAVPGSSAELANGTAAPSGQEEQEEDMEGGEM